MKSKSPNLGFKCQDNFILSRWYFSGTTATGCKTFWAWVSTQQSGARYELSYHHDMKMPNCRVANVLIVVGRTDLPKIGKQGESRAFGDANHAAAGSDAVPFDQGRYDLNSLRCTQATHNE